MGDWRQAMVLVGWAHSLPHMGTLMRILLLLSLVLFSSSVFADEHKIKETDDACTVFAKTAAVIMQARQAGAPMSNLLDIADAAPETDRKLLRLIVMAAYDSPGFRSDEYQYRAVMDFRSKVHLICLKEMES